MTDDQDRFRIKFHRVGGPGRLGRFAACSLVLTVLAAWTLQARAPLSQPVPQAPQMRAHIDPDTGRLGIPEEVRVDTEAAAQVRSRAQTQTQTQAQTQARTVKRRRALTVKRRDGMTFVRVPAERRTWLRATLSSAGNLELSHGGERRD